jgi:hypothetical protein
MLISDNEGTGFHRQGSPVARPNQGRTAAGVPLERQILYYQGQAANDKKPAVAVRRGRLLFCQTSFGSIRNSPTALRATPVLSVKALKTSPP